jgi:tetratricopeptide (TPR) repeat protein
MAGGLIEGALGGDDEGEPAEAASEGLDPTAAGLAAAASASNPELAAAAESYFRKQERLVAIQTEHMHEQRALMLSHLRLRRAGDWFRVISQLVIGVAAVTFAAAIALMLYDAVTSRSVVVEAFDAPPALAPQGITGKVVAAGVLDALQKLATATRATEKALAAQSAWTSDIQIEVPETGISIGQLDRLLHQRFGHDLHVAGELVQTPGGLSLTVRGDDIPARDFAGSSGDLAKITTRAAEYVYGISQPWKFASYLVNNSRNDDALAFLPGAFARAINDPERAKLANSWGNAFLGVSKYQSALAKYRLAIALDPTYWAPRNNVVGLQLLTGGEEAAWRAADAFFQAAATAPPGHRPEKRLVVDAALDTWDLPLALDAQLADAAYNGGAGALVAIDGPSIADIYGLMHDPASAERYMAASDPDDPTTKAAALLLQTYAAMDRQDAAAAVPPMEAYWKAWHINAANIQYTFVDHQCWLGLAYGLSGRMADAEAFFKEAGAWNRCYAFHGDILAHAGDIAGANRVWAEGQRLAPDIPLIYLHRGLSEMSRGDFAAASKAAPHFADPLKAWGDLLAGQGNWTAALAKYNAALQYAPKWPALQQARDAAARKA